MFPGTCVALKSPPSKELTRLKTHCNTSSKTNSNGNLIQSWTTVSTPATSTCSETTNPVLGFVRVLRVLKGPTEAQHLEKENHPPLKFHNAYFCSKLKRSRSNKSSNKSTRRHTRLDLKCSKVKGGDSLRSKISRTATAKKK